MIRDRANTRRVTAGPRRVALLAAVLSMAAILGGCAERDRSNPLDPANLDEGGPLYGFNALAGNAQVELRWNRLTQTGVLGYRLQRWRPGEAPAYLGDVYPAQIAGALDLSAENGESYVYRLVAYLATGDSVTSPTDTATAGARRVVALSGGLPGILGLTPDGRDLLFAIESDERYEDIEADDARGVLWMSLNGLNQVDRLTWTGAFAGPSLTISGPSDVSVYGLTGTGWVASPSQGEVVPYRSILSTQPGVPLDVPGRPRVVEIGSTEGTIWAGTDEGIVFRYTTDHDPLGEWPVGDDVIAMALDEAGNRAFVATRSRFDGTADSLRIIDVADSTVTTAYSLVHVEDLAFDPISRQLWISERGTPLAGQGRLSRASETGEILQSWSPLEPVGIDIDAAGNCWATDLRSQRVLVIAASGGILFWSTRLEAPYQVRVGDLAP